MYVQQRIGRAVRPRARVHRRSGRTPSCMGLGAVHRFTVQRAMPKGRVTERKKRFTRTGSNALVYLYADMLRNVDDGRLEGRLLYIY